MAEEEVQENEADAAAEGSSEEASPKGKKKLFVGGGIAAVIAAGAIAATMAIPSKETKRNYDGPFRHVLFEEQFHCNIHEEGRTRFLQMKPVAMFMSYDGNYLMTRMQDELYAPQVEQAVFRVASTKSLDEIYGEVNESTFGEELKDALDPVLFPVHIGDSRLPWDTDSTTGLRPGLSSDKATFRGRFDEHLLHVDGVEYQLWLDDGPKSDFDPGSLDVRVVSTGGDVIFVDTGGLEEGFTGEVKVGVQGQVRQIIPTGLMVQ